MTLGLVRSPFGLGIYSQIRRLFYCSSLCRFEPEGIPLHRDHDEYPRAHGTDRDQPRP